MRLRVPLLRSVWGSQTGQIVIPAMFLLPSLFVFVFLIYETAKLSRIKIRHQFAVDAAAFVEMTNYSDFLNRSAYVNGAFPMRIFWEGFHDTMLDCMGKDPCPGPTPLSEILYKDGIYPRSKGDPDPNSFSNAAGGMAAWDIEYSPQSPRGNNMNQENPDPNDAANCKVANGAVSSSNPNGGAAGGGGTSCAVIVSMNTAKYWNINWEDANQIYKLYVQIYQLLGSVESAQFSVLQRLQQQGPHNFLTKSYWLNTGGDVAMAEAKELAKNFSVGSGGHDIWHNNSEVKFVCITNVMFHGNQLVHTWGQPYQIWASDPPPQMPQSIGECSGLFQTVTVDKQVVKSLATPGSSSYPGWSTFTRYALDPDHPTVYENYFHVDLQGLMAGVDGGPKVHATVAIGGFGAKPAVWKENGALGPTPKFQVREYP
jgi:hypothetical protein